MKFSNFGLHPEIEVEFEKNAFQLLETTYPYSPEGLTSLYSNSHGYGLIKISNDFFIVFYEELVFYAKI